MASELLECHFIYGNSTSNGHFDNNSRVIQYANQFMSNQSSKIYEQNDAFIVEYQMVKTNFPADGDGHLIKSKHKYR